MSENVSTLSDATFDEEIAGSAEPILVDSFDPVHYVAAIAPRELVVIGARGDAVFPTASTVALYRAAREPKSLRWTSGAHVRSRRTAALDEVLREIERLLEEPAGRGPATPAPGR